LAGSLLLSLWLHLPARAQNPTTTVPAPPTAVYQPITDKERFRWAVKSTIGPQSLAAGVLSAGWGTIFNSPPEYGTNFDGFAARYGMRLTGVSTGNAIEASIGKLWTEDPRYFASPDRKFWGRVRHTARLTFRARRADGELHWAYARYIGNVGNNFLSNTWRVDSESSFESAVTRTFLGFAGKWGGNVFEEFWPSVKAKIKGK
jgi:uncharacterized protein YndB with AHSA1/START domain